MSNALQRIAEGDRTFKGDGSQSLEELQAWLGRAELNQDSRFEFWTMPNRNQYFMKDFLASDAGKQLLLATPRKHLKIQLDAWQKDCDADGHVRADKYPDPQWVVDELLAEYPMHMT